MSVTTSVVNELGTKRDVEVAVTVSSDSDGVSKEHFLNNSTVFQVKVITHYLQSQRNYEVLVFIKFADASTDETTPSFTLYLTCEKYSITDKKFISDDGTWRLLGQTKESNNYLTFNILLSVEMNMIPTDSPLKDLFDDYEMTDFELKGEDGSVKMHKAILAAASPVLRRMLSGPWRERTEGSVDVAGTSGMMLQHLKEYLYLHKLPSNGVEQLLVLAHYYLMTELEDKCISKLISELTPQNALDLSILAAKHDIPKMVMGIFHCIARGFMEFNDIKKSYLLKSNKDEQSM